jgi:hypothetical protein
VPWLVRQLSGDDPPNLRQLRHEVFRGLQPTRGVHDDHIQVPGKRGGGGVSHGCRSSRALGHDVHPPVAPPELL